MTEEEAFEFVKHTLKKERITPYRKDEIKTVHSVEDCINCGLCINHCPVVAAVGVDRFTGPRSIAVELSRSPPEFWSTADKVYLCTGCGTCREVCPKNVNVPEVVNLVRARIFEHRPDLVPKGLHLVREIILEHNLAFEPWEDPEEKVQSRDVRLERLGIPYVEDIIKIGAEVLFYPGCQAEERSQEVREAAKVVLSSFDVDYTLLDEMSCCGLPSELMGDDETSRKLSALLKEKIEAVGIKKVVTTCAGCTSRLSEISLRDNWDIPVYHMVEYLAEEVGLDHLSEALGSTSEFSDIIVTVHDPCHLIRHTSRRTMEDAIEILKVIDGVKVVISEAEDSCCGGGGLVAYHSKDVADAVVQENLIAINKTGADRMVAPCPLCTAQIEDNLFRNGSSVEVDDLMVFIAKRLPKK
ncbi:MAG: (Fe-S)-binding protein [Candidatus Thorarchaeota archaeon]